MKRIFLLIGIIGLLTLAVSILMIRLPLVKPTPPGGGISAMSFSAISTAPKVETIQFGAVTYFSNYCARCHGADGTMMTPKMLGLPPDLMREKVDLMARGPAMNPLETDEDVAAVAAYCQSIGNGQPFATVSKQSDAELGGEVATGTTVFAEINQKRIAATVEKRIWKIKDAAGWSKVVAVKDKDEKLILTK